MEQLNSYIGQARQQGQTDVQIRQSLLTAGWDVKQVNAALTPQSTGGTDVMLAPAMDNMVHVSPEQGSKLALLVVIVMVLMVIIAGIAYVRHQSKTSPQGVTQPIAYQL